MNYTLENFINYCDEMQIAEEKLETNILDKTLAKTMILYHGSPKDLKTISPTSYNMGTRLSNKPRKSSFWTKTIDYAIVWTLDWVAMRIGLPYFHDIERNKFVVPSAKIKLKNGKEFWAEEWILYSLKETPVYVYKADVPTKYIGRGQLAIDEYTVDKDVVPDEKIIVTAEMAKKFVVYANNDDFDKAKASGYGVYSKQKTSLIEKIIFKDKYKVMKERSKLYTNDNQ